MGERVKTFASFYKGMLFGWLAGTTVGLIYASQSGEELRNSIRSRGLELKDQTSQKLEEVRQRAAGLTQQGQSVLKEQRISLLSAVQGVKTGFRVFTEGGPAGNSPYEETSADFVTRSAGTEIQPAPPSDLSPYVQDPGMQG